MNNTFKNFVKEYSLPILLITMFPILLILYLLIKSNENKIDFDTLVAILTSIIIYTGTSKWSIFIFYNSWKKDKEYEYKRRPRFCVDYKSDLIKLSNNKLHQCFFSYERVKQITEEPLQKIKLFDDHYGPMGEDMYGYIKIRLWNNASHLIYSYTFEKIFILYDDCYRKDDVKIKVQDGRIWLFEHNTPVTIPYNDEATIFLGIEKELIDTTKSTRGDIYILLTIEDEFDKKYYYLLPIYYNRGSFMYGNKKTISEKECKTLQRDSKALLSLFENRYSFCYKKRRGFFKYFRKNEHHHTNNNYL